MAELVDVWASGAHGITYYVGSSPTTRINGDIAQLVEHLLCKQEVVGSTPAISIYEINLSKIFDKSGCSAIGRA